MSILIKTIIILSLSLAPIIADINVKHVSPIFWKASKKYVSKGLTEITLQYTVSNPCGVLDQARLSTNHQRVQVDTATSICNKIFDQQITNRIDHMKYPHDTKSKNQLLNNTIPRYKRGIVEYITAAFVTNILTSVVSGVFSDHHDKELTQRQNFLAEQAANLSRQLTLHELILEASSKAIITNSEAIQHNLERIDQINQLHPELMVITSHLVFKIQMAALQLDKILISFRQKRPDIIMLSQLLNTQLLDELDVDSIIIKSLKIHSPAKNTIQWHFVGKISDPNMTVYEINAFRVWTKLENVNKAEQIEYDGPKYLVYNNVEDCAIGVYSHLDSKSVDAKCNNHGYRDNHLSQFKKLFVGDPLSQPANTQTIMSWPDIIVYCYPLKIQRGETIDDCPPFVFSLNASKTFNTSDNFYYSPSSIDLYNVDKIEEFSELFIDIHLKNTSHEFSTSKILNELKRRTLELQEAKKNTLAFTLPGEVYVTYTLINKMYLGTIAVLIMTIVAMSIYGCRKQKKNHNKMMKAVVDHFEGDGTYETIKMVKKNKPKIKIEKIST